MQKGFCRSFFIFLWSASALACPDWTGTWNCQKSDLDGTYRVQYSIAYQAIAGGGKYSLVNIEENELIEIFADGQTRTSEDPPFRLVQQAECGAFDLRNSEAVYLDRELLLTQESQFFEVGSQLRWEIESRQAGAGRVDRASVLCERASHKFN